MAKQRIYLSPSSLQRWYESKCPARYDFERKYEVLEDGEFMARGTKTHALLAGSADLMKETDPLVLGYFSKLSTLRNQMGLDVQLAEHRQEFIIPIDKTLEVMWVRIIDAIGTLRDGSPAIIDFKTTMGMGWKSLEVGKGKKKTMVSPQALAFQSPGYLYVPPTNMFEGLEEWPTKIMYLVAPMRGNPEIYLVEHSQTQRDNFLEALTIAARAIAAEKFPKVYGKHCIGNSTNPGCKMLPVCFGNDWKDTLKLKAKRK